MSPHLFLICRCPLFPSFLVGTVSRPAHVTHASRMRQVPGALVGQARLLGALYSMTLAALIASRPRPQPLLPPIRDPNAAEQADGEEPRPAS